MPSPATSDGCISLHPITRDGTNAHARDGYKPSCPRASGGHKCSHQMAQLCMTGCKRCHMRWYKHSCPGTSIYTQVQEMAQVLSPGCLCLSSSHMRWCLSVPIISDYVRLLRSITTRKIFGSVSPPLTTRMWVLAPELKMPLAPNHEHLYPGASWCLNVPITSSYVHPEAALIQ